MNKDNAVAAPAARLFAAVFVSCSVLFFPATALAQSADDIKDGKVCATCHADAPLIWGGKHGTKADSCTRAGIVGCATCHGVPTEHLKSGSPMPQRLSKMSAGQKNEVCQTCHQGRERMHWPGSAHERNDVSCSSCHKGFTPLDRETPRQTCAICHNGDRGGKFEKVLAADRPNCISCHVQHPQARREWGRALLNDLSAAQPSLSTQ